MVGPGVDASGLYVGMTRGRVHNEAIAIAWTACAAREQIADSLMRGVAEVTIEDSVRAARSELGRAAKVARDRGRRVGAEDGQSSARQLDEWLNASRVALSSLDARISDEESQGHGRAADSGGRRELVSLRARLIERIEVTSRSIVELAQQDGYASNFDRSQVRVREYRSEVGPVERGVETREGLTRQ